MFSVPSGLGENAKIVYIFITYNLVSSVVYTAINVPYSTLNALITQDQYERSVLSIFRMTLATTGTLIITNLTLPLVEFFGDNLSAWTKTFAVFGVLSIVIFLITFAGTKERVKPSAKSKHEKLPFLKGIKVLFCNKYWLMITLTLVCIFIQYSLNGGAAVYYAKVVLHNAKLVGPMNLVASVVQIIAMFFTAFIIKRIGKRNMLIIGAIVYGLGFGMFQFVGTSYFGIMFASALKGIGNAGISSCMFAIVSDTIEYGEWETGYRTEGLINSASSFGFKVGNGLGSAMLGWILALGNYAENAAVQSASSVMAIKALFIYIPVAVAILQIVIMLFYKLDKEYDGIVIPGGLPGATNLRDDARVIEIVQQFNQEHKLIAAICAGPIVLAKAGILKDKICTCSPGFETQLTGANFQEAIVQKDDHIITGKGPAAALEFGYTILESLGYDSSNLRQGMQYEYLMNVEAHKE